MQLIVILLVSVIGHSLGDVLHVKCGDETCEKPSNRAVTTLRYTPDKPYKLTINAVNSEVEIYGETDGLFYIRHGRNYGFLPKNHLREKARGNFLHNVEIDISAFKINQEVRERNFLHEFLKSSQQGDHHHHSEDSHDHSHSHDHDHDHSHSHSHANEINNETVDNQKKIQDNVTEEAPVKTNEERSTEYIPIGIEPKISLEEPAEKLTISNDTLNSNEVNDSGVEDDDEDTEDDDEEGEDDSDDVFDKEEIVESIKESETKEEPKNVEVKPASIDVDSEVLNITATLSNNDDSTTQNPTIVQSEIIEEGDVLAKTIDTEKLSIDKEEEPTEITKEETTTNVQENNFVEIEKDIVQEEVSNSIDILTNVTVDVEKPVHENIEEGNFDIPAEITTESPVVDPPPDIEVTTESIITEPEVVNSTIESSENIEKISSEIVAEENEISTPSNQETTPIPPTENQASQNEDMLLKRFDQKLTHKNHEGVGSVEEMHAHHDHSHSHSHFTHDHSHDHSNSHNQHHHEEQEQKNSDEVSNEEVPLDNAENKKPGFLGGLFKKIFGDTNESESSEKTTSTLDNVDEGFCKKKDDCPNSLKIKSHFSENQDNLKTEVVEKTLNKYMDMAIEEAVSKMDLIISLALTALTTLIFIFGYYCINRARKEGPLIARMNELERHLMAAVKENEMLKADVLNTKQKLVSIEDNSFGSNDMVIALKHDLEESEKIKNELSEKISSMEKELEAAAEDGLELNRMVSELLSNQTGSESIISSVEELQHQLNEQQETIITMNDALAAKSRENTELQIQLSEINGNSQHDMEQSQQKIDALNLERSNLQLDLENIKRESDIQVNQIIEERNGEVTRLNKELTSYAGKYDDTRKLLNGAEAKVQALQECLETIKKSKGGDFKKIIDVADLRADLLAVTKENSTLLEQSQIERDAKKLMEDRVKIISEEMSSLKKEFGAAEKEKLEALTRLDVLSAYFKETEARLQLELSEEKARGMKQQGETMSTVEKIQALNDEIQGLKSQNDSLRAEIEAQLSAHKLNISSIEGQAHSAWLNARQAERKLEESRMEAAALRRRLTSIAENPTGSTVDLMNGLPGNESMNSVSSPHRVESPNMSSMPPVMNMNMPAMPAMPPFMPGAPPFMQMPPFMLSNQAGLPGLPPLGRLMSPPPNRFTPTDRDHRDRYSPRRGNRYSPDSRYDDYTAFETETDYSPPPSPRRGYNSPSDRSNKKGGHSSAGSADSSKKPSRRK